MRIVYRAAHSTDAHLVRQLLEQEGMTAFVNGGFLEGGAGELPMGGLATVSVADEHEARALEVVREWESSPVPPDDEDDEVAPALSVPPQSRSRSPMLAAALLGAAFGAALTWGLMRKSVQVLDADLSGDQKPDERAIYEDERLVRVETDRNHDGNVDDIVHFDLHGRADKVLQDEDFDGYTETTLMYNASIWRATLADRDADAELDYRADAEYGVITSEEWRDAKQNVVKRIRYEKGRTVSGEFDSDGDGKLDTARRYDARGEIVSSSPIAP